MSRLACRFGRHDDLRHVAEHRVYERAQECYNSLVSQHSAYGREVAALVALYTAALKVWTDAPDDLPERAEPRMETHT